MRAPVAAAVTASMWAVVAAFALALSFLASCADLDFIPDVPEPNPTVQRDAPDHLLEFFFQALEGRSIEDYAESLDESYRFEFMDEDWAEAGVVAERPYWGKTQDVESMASLFASDNVISITCDFVKVMDWHHTPAGFASVIKPDLKVDEDRGDYTVTYWVRESWLEITVVPDPYDSDMWVIGEIKESMAPYLSPGCLLGGGSATEPSTFGSLKAMFRPVPG
jgi:hypothetical protein